MTISHRIFQNTGDNRIECNGQIYAEDELHEAIWLVNRELRAGLPKRERIEAHHQITQYEAMLDALRRAGGKPLPFSCSHGCGADSRCQMRAILPANTG